MKNPHDIIKRPILTEKAYEGIDEKRYVFEVDIKANKAEIKSAVEEVFKDDGVKVAKVNTVRTIGKMKRQGRTQGMTPETKKAYVILKKDSKPIKFFEGMAQYGKGGDDKWLFEFTSRLRPPGGICRF